MVDSSLFGIVTEPEFRHRAESFEAYQQVAKKSKAKREGMMAYVISEKNLDTVILQV